MVSPVASFMTVTPDLFQNIFENYSLSLVSDRIHLPPFIPRQMDKQNESTSLQSNTLGFLSTTIRMIGRNGYQYRNSPLMTLFILRPARLPSSLTMDTILGKVKILEENLEMNLRT